MINLFYQKAFCCFSVSYFVPLSCRQCVSSQHQRLLAVVFGPGVSWCMRGLQHIFDVQVCLRFKWWWCWLSQNQAFDQIALRLTTFLDEKLTVHAFPCSSNSMAPQRLPCSFEHLTFDVQEHLIYKSKAVLSKLWCLIRGPCVHVSIWVFLHVGC